MLFDRFKPIISKNKKGTLLLEALLALMILSIIIMPWINFLHIRNANNISKELELFFLTKRVYLETLSDPAPKNRVSLKNHTFLISRETASSNLDKLQVDLMIDGKITYSIAGLTNKMENK